MADRAFRKLLYIAWRAKDSRCWRRIKVRRKYEKAAWSQAFKIVNAYKQFKEIVDDVHAISNSIQRKLEAARKRDAIFDAEQDEFNKRYKLGVYRV